MQNKREWPFIDPSVSYKCRDSGNNIFVPLISDIFVTFPFFEFLLLLFVPKRFQKRKFPLFKICFFSGTRNMKLIYFSFPGKEPNISSFFMHKSSKVGGGRSYMA